MAFNTCIFWFRGFVNNGPGHKFVRKSTECFKTKTSINKSLYVDSIFISSLPYTCVIQVFPHFNPRSGELRTQKLKSHLVRTQSLNVLPLKLGVGQYIATHATLTARDFFLAYSYPFGPFTCIFSKTFPDFSCVGCSLHMDPV